MRKSLVFTLVLSSFISFAQTEYKPEAGNFTTELQFSLFNINAKIDVYNETIDYSTGPFSMSGLRMRYFFSDNLALRATLGFKIDHDKEVSDLDDSYDSYYSSYLQQGERTEKTRYTTFSIAPGLEYHFGNWERMSLYVGGELFFGMKTSKITIDEKSTKLRYNNGNYSGMENIEKSIEVKNCEYYDYGGYYYDCWQNAPMAIGINALFGFDFYIYKGLYMGAELGFGYTYNTLLKGSYKKDYTKIETSSSGTVNIDKDSQDVKLEDKMSSGALGFIYNPMIRLGWKF